MCNALKEAVMVCFLNGSVFERVNKFPYRGLKVQNWRTINNSGSIFASNHGYGTNVHVPACWHLEGPLGGNDLIALVVQGTHGLRNAF
jgi:hypothetical protein